MDELEKLAALLATVARAGTPMTRDLVLCLAEDRGYPITQDELTGVIDTVNRLLPGRNSPQQRIDHSDRLNRAEAYQLGGQHNRTRPGTDTTFRGVGTRNSVEDIMHDRGWANRMIDETAVSELRSMALSASGFDGVNNKDLQAVADGLMINRDFQQSTGGQVPVEVSDNFIDLIVHQSPLLQVIPTIRMLSASRRMDRLDIDQGSLRPTTDTDTITNESTDTIASRTLQTLEAGLATDITLTFLEDNIARGNASNIILAKIAAVLGQDIDNLSITGARGVSPFNTFAQSLGDGLEALTLADSDVTDVDVSGASTVAELFEALYAQLSADFRSSPLVYLVPLQTARRYAQSVSIRQTDLGDQVLRNGLPALPYLGQAVLGDQHVNGTAGPTSRSWLMPVSNFAWGVRRQMRQDTDFRPRRRVFEITTTMRGGFQYSTGDAIVRGTGLVAGVL